MIWCFSNTGIWINLCSRAGTHCKASSIYNEKYPCDAAIDGSVGYGANNEWASNYEGPGAWIKVSIIE